MLVALVGVSTDRNKIGSKMFMDLTASGFTVKGINPKNGEISGHRIYRNLSELGTRPDIIITVVKPEITEKIIEEAKILGVGEIWMQPGSESKAAIEKAKNYGIRVTYGKCFMSENGIW
ncbi:MAG: CoA-binding protein [bacterium]|nr:CoA-binding protein [bacterium]